ncbi:MAG: hypothetical protein KGN77_17050 [Xanthomonadaceae bacterium]|nr:hypothetical protein [Xanthomonadaceae bacterium]
MTTKQRKGPKGATYRRVGVEKAFKGVLEPEATPRPATIEQPKKADPAVIAKHLHDLAASTRVLPGSVPQGVQSVRMASALTDGLNIEHKIANNIPLTKDEADKLTPEQLAHWRLQVTHDAKTRKGMPVATGLLDYFPDACMDVARLSRIGNDQHNPGEPMHWARGKSMDQRDTIIRHTMESRRIDIDKVLHATKAAWRSLAELQLAIEYLRAQGIEYPPKEV